MQTHVRLLLAAIVAAFAIAFAAGGAAANTITAEPAGAISMTSEGRFTFAGRGGIELAVNCRMTLSGSLNRAIDNAAGGALGSITSGGGNECNTGSLTLLAEAGNAWPITLTEAMRLGGTPKLAGFAISNFQFLFRFAGQECLYLGAVQMQLEAEGSPVVTRRANILANAQSRFSGGFLCPARIEFRGSFNLTTQTLAL